MISNILFDVDGTLWDSAEAVAAAWNETLDQGGYRSCAPNVITTEDMYHNMGKTMTEIGLSLFPDLSPDLREKIMKDAMAHENAYLYQHPGKFYPGLVRTLADLQQSCRFFIVSNCQDGYIQAMLSHGSLSQYITDFECFGRTGKPKGESICILLDRNHIPKEEAVYVGDTAMDEAAADQAGISFIHAAYGFGTASHPAAVIHSITELPAALQQLNA